MKLLIVNRRETEGWYCALLRHHMLFVELEKFFDCYHFKSCVLRDSIKSYFSTDEAADLINIEKKNHTKTVIQGEQAWGI